MLRKSECLQPRAECHFKTSLGCNGRESCGDQKWCDDAHDCQPCATWWDPGDPSSSVTADTPASCTGTSGTDPCWMLRSNGCPCAYHGCFRAVNCVESHLCEASGSRHTAVANAGRVAIVTALCHGPAFERKTRGSDSYSANFRFLKLLLSSLAHVQTQLPVYTMVCERRENATEVRTDYHAL